MAIKSQEKPKTVLQETYWRFWEGFNIYTKGDASFSGEFMVHPYPSVRSYQDYHIGEPFHIAVGINFKNKEIHVCAYFSNLVEYEYCFQHAKQKIESNMKRQLIWKEFKTKGSACTYMTADFDIQQGWDNAYNKMAETMIQFKNAFMGKGKL